MKKVFLILLCIPYIACYGFSNSQLNGASSGIVRLDGVDSSSFYKLKNSPVMLSKRSGGSPDKRLFLSKDAGVHWSGVIFANHFMVDSVYISDANYIYVIASGYTGDSSDKSRVLYESRDNGDTWYELRRFTRDFSIGYNFIVTDSRVYRYSSYTSKYDSSDKTHDLVLNGKGAVVTFKNETDAAAFTFDEVYLSKDGGMTWFLKAKLVLPKPPYPVDPIKPPDLLLHYLSDNKFINLTSGVTNSKDGGYNIVQVFVYDNGTYRSGYETKIIGAIFKFFKVDEQTCFISSDTDIFKSIDGGMTWATVKLPSPSPGSGVKYNYKRFIDIKADEYKNLYFVSRGDEPVTRGLFVKSNY